ncbi:hypothetical protein A1Q1_07027 [Trichosporon asahii var. asahii CBS 2479]|uniref:Swi5-dependent recombination DNA repair protein 1 n=1 Tax=Trichosporon asahii var. asahii (strain ATCC 90039 / CBS 2479 / JCM 2466 / KCTC 7840 / NBRC 103889/ NCYC 2677 / UAMH 7654) TaxID=1186058 RepID=J5TNG5_TRIAS|nr:hypothetical protein A1Q1_07027 [Trichosporon asahii var. asahii CBS 2479]EJT51796.1 hypothetical protein A1Q1_07027 [Trichosporon asahii var. asahii CBS 2479]
MSSWSLVLWHPPPSYAPPAEEEPLYTLNPHVTALLRDENRLPRLLSLPAAFPPLCTFEEATSEEVMEPSSTGITLETQLMDVDSPEPPIESTVIMPVDEDEPPPPDATPPTVAEEDKQPSEEDEPSTGVRHQGMHKRPAAEPRPFKSPARIVLRGAKRKPESPLPFPVSSPALPIPQIEWPNKLPPKLSSPSPSPLPRSLSSQRSQHSTSSRRLNAKFKPPGPSSASSDSEPSRSSRRRRGPDAELIASLEQRVRVLKQASACGEDERVVALIQQWRAAGREVTERLFRMIPEPEPELPQRSKGRSSGWGWGWNETFTEPVSRACVAFIRDECAVKNGEIVDPEGVPLQDDVALDDLLPRGGGRVVEAKRPRILTDDDVPAPPEVQPWNRGTMLSKLGVDPALLGFNVEEDDWDDINDD